jgi:hypothetical protein
MRQAGGRACLAEKSLRAVCIVGGGAQQHLDRDRSLQPLLLGQEHRTHPPAADLAHEAELLQRRDGGFEFSLWTHRPPLSWVPVGHSDGPWGVDLACPTSSRAP